MLIDDSVGRITAGKIDVIAKNGRVKGRHPLIYLHSAASDAREIMGFSLPSTLKIARALIDDLQFDLASPTASLSMGAAGIPNDWPAEYDPHKGEVERAIAYHRSQLGGSNEPVVLVGTSMGTLNAIVYAFQHVGEVAALIMFSPVWDLAGYYAANTQGSRNEIEDAWAITYPTPIHPGGDIHDLTLNSGIIVPPMYLVDASDDPYTTTYNSGKYTTWRNAWNGGVTRQALGAVGHGEGTTAAANMTPIKDWLQSVL